MRLVTFDSGDGPRAGRLDDGAVVPLSRAGGEPGGAAAARRSRATARRGRRCRPTRSRSCLRSPTRARSSASGSTTARHAEEQGADPPETPTIFAKFANALAAPGPRWRCRPTAAAWTTRRRWRSSSPTAARTCPRRGAVATWPATRCSTTSPPATTSSRRPSGCPGKVFDGAAPCGPALVTPDEAGDHDAIEIALTLNGEEMQNGTTADLVHSIPALVAYLSQLMTLEPGDIVSTGTPAGVGSLRDPKVWLKPGDEVVVSSPQLGEAGHAAGLVAATRRHDLDALADRLREQARVSLGRPDRDARVATRCRWPRRAAPPRRPCALERARRAPTGRGCARAARPGGSRRRARAAASPSPLRSSAPSSLGSGSPLRCQRAIRAISSSSRGLKPGRPALRIR